MAVGRLATHLCLKQRHDVLQFHVRVDLDDKRLAQIVHESELHDTENAGM